MGYLGGEDLKEKLEIMFHGSAIAYATAGDSE
jgi:hypothetical protein